MRARTVLNKLMLAGPVLFLTAVSINGRAGTPPDSKAIFGTNLHHQLLAYAQAVRSVDALSKDGGATRSPQLITVSSRWIELADANVLTTIMPIDFEVPSQDTVLGQIREAKSTLVYGLESRALLEKRAAHYDEAAKILTSACRVAAINKYCDLSSVHEYSLDQNRFLEQLASIAPNLKPETKAFCLEQISKVTASESDLASIVAHIRMLHTTSLARKGQTPTSIELSQGYGELAEAVSSKSAAATTRLKQISVEPQTSMELVSISTLARLAMKSENSYHSSIGRVQEELQSVK